MDDKPKAASEFNKGRKGERKREVWRDLLIYCLIQHNSLTAGSITDSNDQTTRDKRQDTEEVKIKEGID